MRETYHEIFAYYSTYLDTIHPTLAQVGKILTDLEPEYLLSDAIIDAIREEEEKRPVNKVKVQEEFATHFRGEIFEKVKKYAMENAAKEDLSDIKNDLIRYLAEVRTCTFHLLSLPSIDEGDAPDSLLYKYVHAIQELIFPAYTTFERTFMSLNENSADWYNCQRYILRPQTYYREKIEEEDTIGISPHIYKIINSIISLFNLDPNWLDDPDNPEEEIPGIPVDDVFTPFIDSIASGEKENIETLCENLEMRTLFDKRFIAPTRQSLDVLSKFGFFDKQPQPSGKIRCVPRLSNETLMQVYLAKICMRRGFLSKELINWISANIAFSIFNGVTLAFVSPENPFRSILYDLKTQEKIIPYLMKLICFRDFLRLNRSKIRDSPQYRKEIYNFLGSKIECQERLAGVIANFILEK